MAHVIEFPVAIGVVKIEDPLLLGCRIFRGQRSHFPRLGPSILRHLRRPRLACAPCPLFLLALDASRGGGGPARASLPVLLDLASSSTVPTIYRRDQ